MLLLADVFSEPYQVGHTFHPGAAAGETVGEGFSFFRQEPGFGNGLACAEDLADAFADQCPVRFGDQIEGGLVLQFFVGVARRSGQGGIPAFQPPLRVDEVEISRQAFQKVVRKLARTGEIITFLFVFEQQRGQREADAALQHDKKPVIHQTGAGKIIGEEALTIENTGKPLRGEDDHDQHRYPATTTNRRPDHEQEQPVIRGMGRNGRQRSHWLDVPAAKNDLPEEQGQTQAENAGQDFFGRQAGQFRHLSPDQQNQGHEEKTERGTLPPANEVQGEKPVLQAAVEILNECARQGRSKATDCRRP